MGVKADAVITALLTARIDLPRGNGPAGEWISPAKGDQAHLSVFLYALYAHIAYKSQAILTQLVSKLESSASAHRQCTCMIIDRIGRQFRMCAWIRTPLIGNRHLTNRNEAEGTENASGATNEFPLVGIRLLHPLPFL